MKALGSIQLTRLTNCIVTITLQSEALQQAWAEPYRPWNVIERKASMIDIS